MTARRQAEVRAAIKQLTASRGGQIPRWNSTFCLAIYGAGPARGSSAAITADTSEVIRFEEEMGALLPWHQLAADICLGRVPDADLARRIDEARASAAKAGTRTYDDHNATSDEIALLWGGMVSEAGNPGDLLANLDAWRAGLRRPLYIPTLLALARRAGRTAGGAKFCLTLARSAFAQYARKFARERRDLSPPTVERIRNFVSELRRAQ